MLLRVLAPAFLLFSATLVSADDLPKAKFTAEIDGVEWTIKFADGDKFEVRREDDAVAEGRYKVTGDQVELTDEKASGEEVNTSPGKYAWKLDGKKLTFRKVEDDHKGRVGALTKRDWTRAD